MKVFVDSDIILDLLLQRKPFFEYAEQLFNQIEKKKIRAYTTPIVFANLYYILAETNKKKNFRILLQKIRLLLNVLTVNSKIVDLALVSDFEDFEDALQYYASLEGKIDYIITRNKKDYINTTIPVGSVEDFENQLNF